MREYAGFEPPCSARALFVGLARHKAFSAPTVSPERNMADAKLLRTAKRENFAQDKAEKAGILCGFPLLQTVKKRYFFKSTFSLSANADPFRGDGERFQTPIFFFDASKKKTGFGCPKRRNRCTLGCVFLFPAFEIWIDQPRAPLPLMRRFSFSQATTRSPAWQLVTVRQQAPYRKPGAA